VANWSGLAIVSVSFSPGRRSEKLPWSCSICGELVQCVLAARSAVINAGVRRLALDFQLPALLMPRPVASDSSVDRHASVPGVERQHRTVSGAP